MRLNALTAQVLVTNCSLLSPRWEHSPSRCAVTAGLGELYGDLMSLNTVYFSPSPQPWKIIPSLSLCWVLSPAIPLLLPAPRAPSSPLQPPLALGTIQGCPQLCPHTGQEERGTAVGLLWEKLFPPWCESWSRSIIPKASSHFGCAHQSKSNLQLTGTGTCMLFQVSVNLLHFVTEEIFFPPFPFPGNRGSLVRTWFTFCLALQGFLEKDWNKTQRETFLETWHQRN